MNFQDRRSSLLLDMTYHELLLPHCLDVGICPAEFDLLSQLAISLLQLLLLDFSLAVYFLPKICYDAQDRAALPWGWQIPLAGPSIPARMPPSMMYIIMSRVLHSRATGVKRKISNVSGCSSVIYKIERQATTAETSKAAARKLQGTMTLTGPMGMQYFPTNN